MLSVVPKAGGKGAVSGESDDIAVIHDVWHSNAARKSERQAKR